MDCGGCKHDNRYNNNKTTKGKQLYTGLCRQRNDMYSVGYEAESKAVIQRQDGEKPGGKVAAVGIQDIDEPLPSLPQSSGFGVSIFGL